MRCDSCCGPSSADPLAGRPPEWPVRTTGLSDGVVEPVRWPPGETSPRDALSPPSSGRFTIHGRVRMLLPVPARMCVSVGRALVGRAVTSSGSCAPARSGSTVSPEPKICSPAVALTRVRTASVPRRWGRWTRGASATSALTGAVSRSTGIRPSVGKGTAEQLPRDAEERHAFCGTSSPGDELCGGGEHLRTRDSQRDNNFVGPFSAHSATETSLARRARSVFAAGWECTTAWILSDPADSAKGSAGGNPDEQLVILESDGFEPAKAVPHELQPDHHDATRSASGAASVTEARSRSRSWIRSQAHRWMLTRTPFTP